MESIPVKTGPFKAMFPNLGETEKFDGEDTERFTITMRWPKESADVKLLEDAFKQADQTDGKGHNPIRAGDNEFTEGMVVVKAKTKHPPVVVDGDGNPIDPSSIRSGDMCRARIGFASYSKGSNKGVTVYLNAVQLLKKREDDGGFGDVPEEYRAASDEFPF
jgi:hypothetical protein